MKETQIEIVSVADHYDRMIAEIDDLQNPVTDPFDDAGPLRDWYEQPDGPAFFTAMGDVQGKTVLEVGVGTGRVAQKLLDRGCAHLTGIDISPKTLERAKHNLAAYPNIELLLADAATFVRAESFDIAYCVWSFFHFPDQPRVLDNLVSSLKAGGRLVLSLEAGDEWLEYDRRTVRLYPIDIPAVIDRLTALGCNVGEPILIMDKFDSAKKPRLLSTLIKAEKCCES